MECEDINSCFHKEDKVKPTIIKEYFYCEKCGLIIPKKINKEIQIRAVKPKNYNIEAEIDPLIQIHNIIKNRLVLDRRKLKISKLYLSEREKCISLYRNLCAFFQFNSRTFFSSIEMLDKYMLQSDTNSIRGIYIAAIVCLKLSQTYRENNHFPMTYDSAKRFYSKEFTFSPEDFHEKEIEILKNLNYDLNDMNTYEILFLMLSCGIVFSNETMDIKLIDKIYNLCFGFLIKVVSTQIYLYFEPHIIAFSIIFLVRRYFNLPKDNLQNLKNIFNLQFKSFRDCAQYIKE